MALGRLVCGPVSDAGIADTTLNHLALSIDRFANQATRYLNESFSDDAQSFGAFCARVTLENACAALVGRFDPFRILYLSEYQARGDFEYGRPSKSGFRWTGDVLMDDKPPREPWSADNDLGKISRALFSTHVDHVYWRPAVEKALDYLAEHGTSEAFIELKSIDPETFTVSTRGRCAALYSTLSKGVHWDFFVASVLMDERTLKDAIRDCFIQLGTLGFVSHFVPTAYRSISRGDVLTAYTDFRRGFS